MRKSIASLGLAAVAALLPCARAHNLDTTATSVAFAKDFLQTMSTRAAGSQQLIQVGDEFWVIIKTTAGPGTITGVGGYQTFYPPAGMRVIDAAYVFPDGSKTPDPSGYRKIPMKGQSPIAIGNGDIDQSSTPQFVGWSLPGTNGLNFVTAPVTAAGKDRGTLAGVYADTGIFYSTDPRTAFNTYSGGTMVNNSGDTVGEYFAANIPNSNSRQILGVMTLWDSYQLRAYGREDVNPLLDSTDGRGNAPWGLANVVPGPQSGYAWEFDYAAYLANGGTTTDKLRAAIKIGPWNRVRYPGSQISSDIPGLISTTLGQAGRDASLMGINASAIPSNTTAVRFAIGQLELGRPEYSAVKLKVVTPPTGTCPIIYADAFGGDAGGSDGGKDHIWRYFDPTVVSLNPCTLLQKVASQSLVAPKEKFYYDIVFVNNGNVALPNVVLTDTLPTGIVHLSAVPTQTSFSGQVYRWDVGTVNPGQVITIRQNVQATGTGTLFNTVTATSNGTPVGVAQESVEVGVRSILNKSKVVNKSTAAPGELVEYSMLIENIGSGPSGTPIVVREFLPPGFTYVDLIDAELNKGKIKGTAITVNSSNPNRPVFTVTQSLKAGNALTITFSARIDPTVTLGTYYNSFQIEYEGKVVPPIPEAPVTVGGGKIGDTVFRDWNGDGDQDAGEQGIGGVTVNLYRDADNNGSYETLVGTRVTDANGNYLFTGLPAGNYRVEVPTPGTGGVPAGYVLTADPNGGTLSTTFDLALAHEQQFLTADFGFQPLGTGTIGDQVFEDVNKSGIWDSGEPNIPNVTVNLYVDNNANGVIDSGDLLRATTATDPVTGIYSFTGLATDVNYLVQLNTLDADINQYFIGLYGDAASELTSPATQAVAAGFTNHTTADFGYWRDLPASVGDQVFVDNNLNGIYDAGDTPIGNITVGLYDSTGTVLLDTRVTGPLGTYLFDGLPSGNYVVKVDTTDPDVPSGFTASVSTHNVTLASGQNFLTADFPFVTVFNKSVNLASAAPGDLLTYTLYPYWPGPSLLTNAKVTDVIPDGTNFVSVSQGGTVGDNPVTSDPGVPGSHPGSSGSGSATLTAIKDTSLNSASAGTNYGAATTLTENRGGGDTLGTRFILTQFDLSSIPAGVTVTGAQFLLTKTSTNDPNVPYQIYPLLKAWDEGTLNGTAGAASYNLRVAGTYWGGGTTPFDRTAPSNDFGSLLAQTTVRGLTGSAPTTYTWSDSALTTQVANWYVSPSTNYGLVMGSSGSGTDNTVWNSRENTGTKPRLVVTYTGTASPATTTTITAAPSSVTTSGNVTVTMTVTATGAVSGITAPANLTVIPGSFGANATKVSGPTGSPANIGVGGGSAVFTWVYNVTAGSQADQVKFSGVATGTGATFGSATSNGVVATNPTPADSLVTWNLGSNSSPVGGSAVGGAALNQWASSVVNFSSQYTAGNWSALQALGPPNTNTCGDIETAWAPLTNGSGPEFLHLGFTTPVYATGVSVRETFNSGFVTGITLYEPNGTTHSITIPSDTTACPGFFTVTFPQTAYLVNQVRINTAKAGWEEIDAVQLLGVEQGSNTTTSMSALPALVTAPTPGGANVAVSMTVTSSGAVTNVTAPANLTVNGTNGASATKVSGPTGSPISFGSGGGTATFTWVYNVTAGSIPGQVTFAGTPTGTGATFGAATSNGVIVTPPLTMQVEIISPDPGVPFINNTAEFYNGPTFLAQDNAITSLTGSIGDFVWLDADGDGVQDSGEFGIGGVTVNVYADDGTTLLGTATTDASGYYRVFGLTAGDYVVSYDLDTAPAGYFGTTAPSLDVTLATDFTQYNDADFGLNVLPIGPNTVGSIGDFVWLDANNNGLQDPLEPGIPNVNIVLERLINGNWVVIGTDTTDASGSYDFAGLAAGDYRVTVDTSSQVSSPYAQGTFALGSVMAPTFDLDGTGTPHASLVTLATDDTVIDTVDFGYNWSGSIGDYVWWDDNTDGLQNETPLVGIPNARVQLYFDADFDGVLNRVLGDYEILRVFTDASGNYFIPNLPPGNYFVDVYEDSLITDGVRDIVPTTDDLVPVILSAGSMNVDTADFGYFEGARAEALVFWDANHDGIRGPDEEILSGITVTLTGTDSLGNPVTRTAETDSIGYISFLVPEGDYTISYDLADRAALFPTLGSQTTEVSFEFEAVAGEDGIRRFDFGVDNTGSIGDTIFADLGTSGGVNGQPGSGDFGLPDITVNLYLDLDGDGIIDPEDELLDLAVTDSAGNYAFIGLPDTSGPSRYLVQVDSSSLPATYLPIPTSYPSGANTGESIYTTVLTGGQTINTVDFGYPLNTVAFSFYSVSGRVWEDQNKDTLQAGEDGIPAVTVQLFTYEIINGYLDLNDDGVITSADDGTYGGFTVTDGVIAAPDDTEIYGVTVKSGGLDVDNNGSIGASDDRAPLIASGDTNSNGDYEFLDVPEGEYRIVVDPTDLPSSAFVQTYDPNGLSTPNETRITVVDTDVTNQDFGYAEDLGSIAGTVVLGDGDGFAEVGETPFGSSGTYPAVMVTLRFAGVDGFLGTPDDVLTPTTTDTNGNYSFGNLLPGLYEVTTTVPSGYFTLADADGLNPNSINVTLGVGQDVVDRDFEYEVSSLAGTVRVDTNGNGSFDSGEPPIANVEVFLDLNNDGDWDPGEPTTDTDASGAYLFPAIDSGTYVVRVVSTDLPPGSLASYDPDGVSSPHVGTVTVPVNTNVTDVDFGYYETATVGDLVFNDVNGDGIQDGSETGLAGVTVTLYRPGVGPDGISGNADDNDPVALPQVTDGTGLYNFPNLPPGNYQVSFSALSGHVRTFADVGSDDALDSDANPATGLTALFVLSSGETNDTIDAGYYQPAEVSGYLYVDANGNGSLDANELPITGVTVFVDTDNDGVFDVGEPSDITDATGFYLIENLPPGTHIVTVVTSGLPAGLTQTGDPDGTMDNETSVTLAANESLTDQNFGYQGNSSIGDLVWYDINGDGDQDAGEPGLSGITVYLDLDEDGTLDDGEPRVITNASGAYLFPGLLAGTYQVRTVPTDLPVGLVPSFDADGVVTPHVATVILPLDTDLTNIDFGYEGTATITGHLYLDENNNGTQDPTEPNLPNVSIVVTDALGGVQTVVTDSNGDWSAVVITGLANADIDNTDPDLPLGAIQTEGTDSTDVDAVENATEFTDNDGFFVPASIAGTVFERTYPGGVDAPQAGVTVTLRYAGPNGTFGDGDDVLTPFLAVDGTYSFTGLVPGNYQVTQTVPSGFTAIDDADDGDFTIIGNVAPIALTPGLNVTGRDFVNSLTNDLAITKEVSPTTQLVGSQVVFTLTAENLGPVAATGVEVDDILPAGYTFVSANPPAAYNSGTGKWEIGDLAVSGEVILTITATINSAGPYLNTAIISGDQPETNLVNNTDTAEATPILLGSISGFVLEDTDNDNLGDAGIEGVLLTLVDSNGDPVDDPNQPGTQDYVVTSGVDGSYSFVNLPSGTYGVKETQPAGYTSLFDADSPIGSLSDKDEIRPIEVLSGQDNANNDFVEMDSCPSSWADWKQLHPTETAAGNPDADRYDNFTEFAFAMPYDSGTGYPNATMDGTAWFIRPYSGTDPGFEGTIEAVFVRPKQAIQNVTYRLQYAATIGSPTVWSELVIDTSPTGNATFVDNGDCTETVTVLHLEAITGLGDGEGVVRIEAELDDDGGPGNLPDGDVDQVSYTEPEGWKETEFGICCQTYCTPYLVSAEFIGTVETTGGVTGQTLALTNSSGSVDLGAQLVPGTAYFLEVTAGENEGHRFDVVSATANTVTLAVDSDLYAAGAPFNTLLGALPASLAGDAVVIRRHRTLNELFPPASFGATALKTTADEIQTWAGGAWQMFWLSDPDGVGGVAPAWLSSADDSPAGSTVIPPGQGLFFNNREAKPASQPGTSVFLLSYGEVRENDFRLPLAQGNNLVGGGYPIDQSPNGRNMNLASAFFGSRDFKTADSVFVWRPDANVNHVSYDGYYYLNGAPTSSILRWVKTTDTTLVNRSAELLMKENRAVFIRVAAPAPIPVGEGLPNYGYPAPWAAGPIP